MNRRIMKQRRVRAAQMAHLKRLAIFLALVIASWGIFIALGTFVGQLVRAVSNLVVQL